MAVDTREKRMNAARVGRPWMRAKHAVGATDQQSRIASGHGYGGNALSPAAGGGYGDIFQSVVFYSRVVRGTMHDSY